MREELASKNDTFDGLPPNVFKKLLADQHVELSASRKRAVGPAVGVAADVRPNYKSSALSDYKTGGNAVILFRA